MLTAPTAAMAFLPHPASWKQVSDDGRHVLVMVSPLPVDEDAGHPSFDAQEIRRLRATYTQSGLYRNDGGGTPIWTLPYHDWTRKVFIGPEGRYLVIADDDWQNSRGHVASFYSNGNRLASYSVTGLVASIRLKSLVNGEMVGCGGIAFDADARTFTSRTSQGETFVFDITTGRMVRHPSPFPAYIGIAAAALLMAIIFLLLLMYRRRNITPTKNYLPLSHATERSQSAH